MYKIHNDGKSVQQLSTMAIVPNNLKNRDWRKYQAWLAEGNVPMPEFTEKEKKDKKQRKKENIKLAIVDMRLRKDAANAEGFADLEAETQSEINGLRAELSEM